MAILLVLLALFAFVFAGFGSGSSGTSTATMPRRVTTYSKQSAKAHTRVTVRTTSDGKTSVSCVARVRIKGASVQTQRRCRYLPVSP